ncbi:right-handed parallel beta-helix repeat-containing protein, partial [bacterium]|nr:right-handed parallel beta-helix repeat-containing protein [bacterium]
SDSNKLKLVRGSDIATSTGITIDASGNVGIGTTTPTAKLTIIQSGTGNIVEFKDSTTTVFAIQDGGNVVVSEINNTIYVDGTKYPADGAGIQKAINDLGPSGGKVILPQGTYNIGATSTIDTCDSAWTASANVTSTTDTSDKKEGTASVKFEIDDAFTTGTIAYHTISSIDISEYSNIKYWIKTSSSKNYGVFKLILDDTSDCSSPLKEIDLPETRTFWENHYLNLGDTSGLTNITCVGIKAVSDPGAITIRIDDIKASKGPILIQKSNVTLQGVGETTKLYLLDEANIPVIQAGTGSHQYQRITISDLQIDGNKDNQSGDYTIPLSGIYFKGKGSAAGVDDSKIERVYVHDTKGVGIYISMSLRNIVSHCRIEDVSWTGLVLSPYNTAIGNFIKNVGRHGISISHYCRVEGNYVTAPSSVDTIYAGGIYCLNCDYASIVNNTISDFGGNGIYLWCGEHTTVSGNAVYEAHYHGIYIEGNNSGDADYNTIISNTIRNSSQKADNTYSDIYLSDNGVHYATHNIISGNTIYASASNKSKYGIAEKSSSDDYNIITNNIISGPYTDISIQGPHTTLSGNKTSDSTEPLYNIETASTAASTALTVTQSGTGDIVNLYDGSYKVF